MMTNKKNYICLIATLILAGCQTQPLQKQNIPVCKNGVCQNQAPQQTGFQGHDYVSYTDVAADYKAYGERTPLDSRVGTSGAASNLSSSIPPVLEEEVALYEDDVNGFNSLEEEVVEEEVAEDSATMEDPIEDWLAEEGVTLKDLLSQWSQASGWRLIWKTNRNYTLTAGAMFRARFADAASALVRAFARAKPAPIATFYKGNRVLVIETMEDENAY